MATQTQNPIPRATRNARYDRLLAAYEPLPPRIRAIQDAQRAARDWTLRQGELRALTSRARALYQDLCTEITLSAMPTACSVCRGAGAFYLVRRPKATTIGAQNFRSTRFYCPVCAAKLAARCGLDLPEVAA